MKFQRVIEAVYFAPWSITRAGWQTVHAVVKPYVNGEKLKELKSVALTPALSPRERENVSPLEPNREGLKGGAASDEMDFFGNPLPKMTVTPDGVAIIPIQGVMLHHASLLEKQCGACSYDDIKDNVRTALGLAGLQKIVFHVDSPGGMSMGSDECASVVSEAARVVRTEAVSDGQICSAAYHVVCPSARITCTPSAEIGSIGTLMPWLDQTVRYEMAGLKMNLFRTDELKGAGWPGTELSEEQRGYFQSMVDKYGDMFKARVRATRPVDEETMRGQVFIGSDAFGAGLVDEVMDDVQMRFEAEPFTEGNEGNEG